MPIQIRRNIPSRALALLATMATSAGALPATAAAEPAVTPPSSTSIRSGRPIVAFAPGPAGERVTEIVLATRTGVDAAGRLDVAADAAAVRLQTVEGQVRIRPRSPLSAGRWHWQAWWTSVDGSGTTGATRIRSLVVPARLGALRGAYTQMSETPAFEARGSVATNARTAVATCAVYAGRSLVTRTRVTLRPSPTRRAAFRCRGMRVAERLDGRLATLRVVVRGGGRSVVASTRFRAT